MTPTLTPEDYERAVELAKFYIRGLMPGNTETDIDGISQALLHAHAQRRTAGTVEMCELCKIKAPFPLACKGVCTYGKDPSNCPIIRAGRNEK